MNLDTVELFSGKATDVQEEYNAWMAKNKDRIEVTAYEYRVFYNGPPLYGSTHNIALFYRLKQA